MLLLLSVQALKQDELQQLAKQAEEASSEQPKQAFSSETGSSSGVVVQLLRWVEAFLQVSVAPAASPSSSLSHLITAAASLICAFLDFRPSLYQSADTKVESEAAFGVTEEQAELQAAAGEASRPLSPPSSPRQPSEPVCYSVEAVLGPQRSRPFTQPFPAPGQKEFQPLYSAERLPANPSRVPYAGDAALSARKAPEDPVLGRRFSPEPRLKEVRLPQLSPDPVHETVWCWNRPQENRLRSVLHTGLDSKRCWNLPLTSAKLWKPGEKKEAPEPSPQASDEATFADRRCSVSSPADVSPRCSPTESGASADPGSPPLKVEEPSESQRELQSGSEEQRSAENPAERSADCADLRRPFRCLFAAPLSESLKRSHRPALIQSSPTCQSADRTKPPGGAPSSFLSLFAAPLGAAPFPPQSSVHSQRKQRGKMETVLSRAEPAEEQPASQSLSPNPSRRQGEERSGAEEAQPGGASQAGTESTSGPASPERRRDRGRPTQNR